MDLERAVPSRLTFDGRVAAGSVGGGSEVVWSPDGSRAAYMYSGPGHYDVYEVLAGGAARPEPLVQSSVLFKWPVAWSPDGKSLVFCQNDEGGHYDLWLLPLRGDREPVPYLRTSFSEDAAAISPDRRWLAYASDETGRSEIYVGSFPQPGDKRRVSISGGVGALWSKNGKELLIWTYGQRFTTWGPVYTVDVETAPTFKAGIPRVLFTPRQDLLGLTATSDLQRFLAAVPVEGAAPPSITVVLNWQASLPP